MLVEFGSGSSKKTRLLIEAILGRQGELVYAPIDISADYLRETATTLLDTYPGLSVHAVAGEYFDVAAALPQLGAPRLILFLGSNIGNLEREEAIRFLSLIAQQMSPDERLLVGIDLVKDPRVISAAYNDSQGVTAEFNKNLLRRLNRELNANFDLDHWRHVAPYDQKEHRIEMLLQSLSDQTIQLEAIGREYRFQKGQHIHTEWSHKYTLDSFARMSSQAGLTVSETWLDDRHWFASVLLRRRPLE